MTVPITALYAGLSALVLMWIAFGTGSVRGKKKISIGDGGDIEMIAAMRRHANAVENIPIALILIGVLELNGANAIFLHVLGAVLVIARILHPLGLKPGVTSSPFRAIGTVGSVFVIVVAAVYAIWQFASPMM